MMSNIVVKKFGGTSVGSPKNMRGIVDIIRSDKTDTKIIVLSALSGTTNSLVSIHDHIQKGRKADAENILSSLRKHYKSFLEELLKEEKAVLDVYQFLDKTYFSTLADFINTSNGNKEKEILAMGEQMSTFIFSQFLERLGIQHQLLDALRFMKIDGDEQPDMPSIEKEILLILQQTKEKWVITQGYICRNQQGEVDNLKRGGSDYTASIIAACVRATCCEIWTDIDGMHNNDPRIVEKTFPIKQLSFAEASELAYFGAKVLHPTCITPAQQRLVPVKILNTMAPEAVGTTISDENITAGEKAIAAKDGITAVRIKSSKMLMAYGFLTKVFGVFESYKTPIDMITTSEIAVSVTIDDTSHFQEIKAELEKMGTIDVDTDLSIICIVGYQLIDSTTLLKKIFNAIDNTPIRMISHGGSKNNISILVHKSHKTEVLKKLNSALFHL